jgi:hypothetical protein
VIVRFDVRGRECVADVCCVGTSDECTDWNAPDERYEIDWIQDTGSGDQLELDNAAVAAFLEVSK